MVGIAHYLFHASVWYSGKCYLADLFVDTEVRRRGVATAVRKGFIHYAYRRDAD